MIFFTYHSDFHSLIQSFVQSLFYILNSIQPPVRSSKLHYWPLAFTKKNGTFWDKLGHFGTPASPALARSLFILYFAYVRDFVKMSLMDFGFEENFIFPTPVLP